MCLKPRYARCRIGWPASLAGSCNSQRRCMSLTDISGLRGVISPPMPPWLVNPRSERAGTVSDRPIHAKLSARLGRVPRFPSRQFLYSQTLLHHLTRGVGLFDFYDYFMRSSSSPKRAQQKVHWKPKSLFRNEGCFHPNMLNRQLSSQSKSVSFLLGVVPQGSQVDLQASNLLKTRIYRQAVFFCKTSRQRVRTACRVE